MTTVAEEPAPVRSQDRPRKPSVVQSIWRSYFLRRLVRALLMIWLVATLVFFMVRLMPGNPVDTYTAKLIAEQGLSYEQARAQAATLFQFDSSKPLVLQYVDYLRNLLHGDMGTSIVSSGTTVASKIAAHLPWTMFSVGISMVIAIGIGLVFGMIMAYRRGGIFDHAVSIIGSLLHAIPNYLLAMLIVVVGGVKLKLFDFAQMRGSLTAGVKPGFTLNFIQDIFYHAALPILTYVLTTAGTWALVMKSSTTQVLGEDYVTVARARGLSGGRIAGTYVGRNAVLPLVAQIATQAGFVVGGAIFVEQTFAYDGIGIQLYKSINFRDYPIIQGILLMITIVVIFANLLADFIYSFLDPRIRTDERKAD
ncbi:ABC transporter permease [Aestuariimicrobium soli]|uniref:ABC transporter permease n=1 Tax=Aestuariimicrobium soli TaxID=2035834 RepID=UPI003EBBA308